MEEDTRPKFWIKDVLIPERVCQKVDPSIFLKNFVYPFMIELSKAIATARSTGKAFYVEAHIRFPEYLQFGGLDEKDKSADENRTIKAMEEDQPGLSGIGPEPKQD